MAQEPLRRSPRKPSRNPDEADRPKIWAEGGQRPPFDLRALGRASLHQSRSAVAPLLAWTARATRRGSERVRDGKGRIPSDKLGRAARFVPSHLRVAAWIKNSATVLAHASANADPEVLRGNALVAEIEPHLWEGDAMRIVPPSDLPTDPPPEPRPDLPPEATAPVVLPEPMQPDDDPLAAIRGEMAHPPAQGRRGRAALHPGPEGPALPPVPPGPLAVTAIQVSGYLLGWGMAILALPYGLAQSLWLYAKGTDLRGIGRDD